VGDTCNIFLDNCSGQFSKFIDIEHTTSYSHSIVTGSDQAPFPGYS